MKQRKRDRLHNIFIIVQGLCIFTGLLLLIVAYANWSAFQSELNYSLKKATPSASPTPNVPPSATPIPIVEAPHLLIDTIGLDVPISWDVPAELTTDYLNKGVAHLAGSAHLGEVGNLFITGHSSDYVWKHNPYAATFALLPKLKENDTITIRENGQVYTYKVNQTRIVNPDQVEVANQTTTPVLTLMTCYPIGTTRQRFIVHASLVSSPNKVNAAATKPDYTLPEIKFR